MNERETEPPDDGGRGAFWLCFAACAVLALAPLWIVKYLPMVDLPQHAAQISIWKNLADPRFGFADYFELEYRTPYLAGYLLARLCAEFTSVLVALKIEISVSVVALPSALLFFLRRARVSRWWCLVGFPLAYGYSFRWGFLNFMLGVPVALVYLPVALAYARKPSVRAGIGLALFTIALYWFHGLLLGFCGALVGLAIVAAAPRLREVPLRALPLAAPLPLVAAWMAHDHARTDAPLMWGLGPFRLADLFTLYGYGQTAMAAVYIALFGLVVALRARGPEARRARDALPLALAAAVVLFCPFRLLGTAFIASRFNVLLVPFLLAWMRPAAPRAVPVALVGLTALVTSLLVPRFRAFDADARDYDVVAASIAPRPRLRPLIFLPGDTLEFLHFPAWTQVEKGGLYGFSFARAYPVARYKPTAPRLMGTGDEHNPWGFDLAREASAHYDHFVVRSDESDAALAAHLFGNAPGVRLVATKGLWHVFRAAP
jgi:hypothetical protein